MKPRKTKKCARQSIADLIGHHRGARAQFARELLRLSGRKVTWACVNHWVLRNTVSKSMVLHVHRLTGVPLTDLLR